jgi:hypothetical protein
MTPLSHNFRRWFLWALVAVFVVGTPVLIGYSKGYRLDDALSLIATGGIYLHSEVPNASVYLDDTFLENNGAFLRNTYIQDLTPGHSYAVRVEKTDYQSWVKRLPVFANLVTEAHVMMLPTTFSWQIVTATTTIATPPGSTATSTDVADPHYAELTKLFADDKDQFAVDIATSTFIKVKGKEVATTTTVREIQFPDWLSMFASSTGLASTTMVREREGIVTWLKDGNLHAAWARPNDPPPYYFCAKVCKTELTIDWAEPITRYEFYPNRNDAVIVGTDRGIYAVELDDRSQRNIQPFMEAPGLSFRLDGDKIVIFDGKEFREANW